MLNCSIPYCQTPFFVCNLANSTNHPATQLFLEIMYG